MTKDEYFKAHLPHRVNLLTTFRDRYSHIRVMPRSKHRRKLDPEEARDLFRCAKDISMTMVRFFCDEMGLYLREGASDPEDRINQKKNGQRVPWAPAFTNTHRFRLQDARKDPRYAKLVIVLKAANRAVVHINETDVDHPIRTDEDNEILFDVVDWVEALIESHIYQPNGESLEVAMRLPNNDMDPPPHLPALARTY
jgi:hypothetical protein